MKKILLFVAILFCCSTVYAEDDTTKTTPGEVFCEKGYVFRKGKFRIGKIKCYFEGLYTADGKVCVRVNPHIPATYHQCIAPGTEIVAKGALPESVLGWVYLPKSVKTISTEAFANDLIIAPYDESKLEDLEETTVTDYMSEVLSKK